MYSVVRYADGKIHTIGLFSDESSANYYVDLCRDEADGAAAFFVYHIVRRK